MTAKTKRERRVRTDPLERLQRIAEELDGLGDGQEDYLGKLAVRLRREVVRLRALFRDRAGERLPPLPRLCRVTGTEQHAGLGCCGGER